jgi:hypothetical protein
VYFVVVVLMLVLPLVSNRVNSSTHGGFSMVPLVARWFVLWTARKQV